MTVTGIGTTRDKVLVFGEHETRAAPRVWFSEPYLRLDVEEAQARWIRPGAYVMYEDVIRKVVRIERPEDWFTSTVTLVLEDGNHEPRDPWESSAFLTLLQRLPASWTSNPVVRWLEDVAFPKVTR